MKSNIEQRRIMAYLDSFPLTRDLRQARLASHKGMKYHRGTITGEEMNIVEGK